jgi:hypothetical protein
MDTFVVEMAELIRELVREFPDGVPMGPCYMAFMQKGVPLATFNTVVDYLVERGEVRVSNHCMFPV